MEVSSEFSKYEKEAPKKKEKREKILGHVNKILGKSDERIGNEREQRYL